MVVELILKSAESYYEIGCIYDHPDSTTFKNGKQPRLASKANSYQSITRPFPRWLMLNADNRVFDWARTGDA